MIQSQIAIPFRFGTSIAAMGVASLLLTGCSAIQVKMGWRVSLSKTPVASIEASLPKNPGIAPGEKSPLVVAVTGPDGKVLLTEGQGKGKVLWKDLAVTATVVSVNKKGILTLPKDPRVSDGKTGRVEISVPSHPGVETSLDIPLRYDYGFVANYAGASGINGTDGTAGIDGISGTMGSIDPNNPSPGGNGTNGTNGSDGGNGGDGSDGPPVQVLVTLRAGSHPLLQVGVLGPGRVKERFYLVDPQGGSLTVNDRGGSGGTAGKGGRGGRGGSGGIGTPNGSNGTDGSSGQDGRAGSDGRGGQITVIYDPSAQPYLSTLHVNSPGGPKPVFVEQPVGPLW
jgi:hypothetical protein